MSSHEARFEIVITPQGAAEEEETARSPERAAVRRAAVEPTGETGASGYPRYAGEGVEADIDPVTATVEALTVDGDELPYGWTASVARGGEEPDGPR
ncbi:hypothetical protein ACWGJ2_11610 [Streptomyces sp. NPDC054796]